MINEHDITDWIHFQPTKLYNLEPKSYFCFQDAPNVIYYFEKADGLYSVCYDKLNRVCHVKSYATVVPVQARK
jgi:hypothetical protein